MFLTKILVLLTLPSRINVFNGWKRPESNVLVGQIENTLIKLFC